MPLKKIHPPRLTLAEAKAQVRTLGFSLKSREGEYVLTPWGEREGAKSYYTNDLKDAVGTARASAGRAGGNARGSAGEPPHPASGFGKEQTVADIRRRIAWETWAETRADAVAAQGHRQARIGYVWLLAQHPAVIRVQRAKMQRSHPLDNPLEKKARKKPHGHAAGRAKKGKYRIEGYDGDFRTRDMLAKYSDGHRIYGLFSMTEPEVLAEASRWMGAHPPPQDTYGKRPYVMISDMGRGGPYTIAVFEAKGRAWVRAR
jgi:hypothetical protein